MTNTRTTLRNAAILLTTISAVVFAAYTYDRSIAGDEIRYKAAMIAIEKEAAKPDWSWKDD